jgi:hypothetical protein
MSSFPEVIRLSSRYCTVFKQAIKQAITQPRKDSNDVIHRHDPGNSSLDQYLADLQAYSRNNQKVPIEAPLPL